MKMFSITLPKILILLSIIILVDLVLVIIMYVVDPYKPNFFIPDVDRQINSYYECSFFTSNNSGFIVIILLLIKVILLISGIVCTFLTRNVKYIHLNESKWIAYSIYNLFFSAVIVIIFEGILTIFIARDILFVVRSVFIIYPTLVTNMCIFLPKFYFYFRGKDTRQRQKHSGSTDRTKSSNIESSTSKSTNSTYVTDINYHKKLIEGEFRIGKLEKNLKRVREQLAEVNSKRRTCKRIEALYLERIIKLKEN